LGPEIAERVQRRRGMSNVSVVHGYEEVVASVADVLESPFVSNEESGSRERAKAGSVLRRTAERRH
jgi:hypothetical protein